MGAAGIGNSSSIVAAAATWNQELIDQRRSEVRTAADSKKMLWSGRVISTLAVLFLLFDGIMKFTSLAMVAEAQSQLGIAQNLTLPIGILELACVLVYMIPRTSILGAILLTGYLGGATAIHVRVDNPLFTHVLFPAYVGMLLWGGLYLRDRRLRQLVPLRSVIARDEVRRVAAAKTYVASRGMNRALWFVQALLALLFLFAGGTKLILSMETLTSMGSPDQIVLPGLFIRFIGVAEVLGAVGLILPRLLRVRPGLTPLAAVGLVIIMIGATAITLAGGDASGAFVPLAVGILSSFVAYGRWSDFSKGDLRSPRPAKAGAYGVEQR